MNRKPNPKSMSGFFIKYQGQWKNVTQEVDNSRRNPSSSAIFPGYVIYYFQHGRNVGPISPPVLA